MKYFLGLQTTHYLLVMHLDYKRIVLNLKNKEEQFSCHLMCCVIARIKQHLEILKYSSNGSLRACICDVGKFDAGPVQPQSTIKETKNYLN